MIRASFVALLLVGCGASDPLAPGALWPKFRGDLAQTARTNRSLASGGKKWTYPTGKGIFSSPIVAADGTIYVGSADRSYYALDPDGTLRWKIDTGEIIDSAGLLDDRGRVYFGSGDGILRAADARTGALVWMTPADDPSVNKAYINWFEGNVGITPGGRLIVPNDNFFLYGVERDGSFAWKRVLPDQTWALPAVGDLLYVANNNTVDFLGPNTIACSFDDGTSVKWQQNTAGTNAASPILPTGAPDLVVFGSFDGYVHALQRTDGTERWNLPTRDHVYASAAELSDGTLVVPSTDGTVYAMDPKSGAVRWTFDALDPIRSSPAVDGDDRIYFGGGDGKLYVLNHDGTLRWSLGLIDDVRNDLNASPALGRDAVYLAGESGEIFSVPADYCLQEGASDPKCATSPVQLPAEGSLLLSSTAFGAYSLAAPDIIDANQALGFTLVARQSGATVSALLDVSSLQVTTTPTTEVDAELSGDGHFLLVTPKTAWVAGADGHVQIHVGGTVLGNPDRMGLRMSGGTPIGAIDQTVSPLVRAVTSIDLKAPASAGDPQSVLLIDRLALPLPTMLPSYNQIGFDSLGYVVGLLSFDGTDGLAVMVGALVDGQGGVFVDPLTRAVVPLLVHRVGGAYTLENSDGLSVEVMNAVIPFHDFRLTTSLDMAAGATGTARLGGSSTCVDIPTYGLFLDRLGLCNAQTGRLTVFGAANLRLGDDVKMDAVTATATNETGTIIVSFPGVAATHFVSMIVLDDATGLPVPLDYGLTVHQRIEDGNVTGLLLDTHNLTLPAARTGLVFVDTYPVWRGALP